MIWATGLLTLGFIIQSYIIFRILKRQKFDDYRIHTLKEFIQERPFGGVLLQHQGPTFDISTEEPQA